MRASTLRIAVVFLAWLALPAAVEAQWADLRTFSVAEGLPQSQVGAILQGQSGYMWVGTSGGIGRFDGRSFLTWGTDQGLSDGVIYDILQLPGGDLWFASQRGIDVYDGRAFAPVPGTSRMVVFDMARSPDGTIWLGTDTGIQRIRSGRLEAPEWAISGTRINAVHQASNGDIWFGTTGAGAIRVSPDAVERVTHLEGLPGADVFAVAEDRDGLIWLGTENGVAVYDSGTVRTLESEGLPHPTVRSLLVARNGTVWAGTDRGVGRWTSDGFVPFAPNWLRNIPVWSIAEDHEGTVHFGSSGHGLFVYTPTQFQYVSKLHFQGRTVWSIVQDHEGSTLFGLEGGIMRLRDGEFTDLSTRLGLEQVTVRSLYRMRGGDLAIGTQQGVYLLNREGVLEPIPVSPGLELREVRSLAEDAEGHLLVATRGFGAFRETDGVLRQLTASGWSPDRNVWDIHEDSHKRIWLATDQGLAVIDGANMFTYDAESGLPGGSVLSLAEDASGHLWAGTLYSGFAIIDLDAPLEETLAVDRFGVSEGLSDKTVLAAAFDRRGDLWASTNNGLNRIDVWQYHKKGRKRTQVFGPSDGYRGIEGNLHSVWNDDEGRMWFGNVEGIAVFDPLAEEPAPEHPITQITGLRINFNDRDWGDAVDALGVPVSVSLPYADNHVTFDFVGLTYRRSGGVVQRHRLVGFDDEWSPATDMRAATFSNLPPGPYTFEVQTSPDGVTWPTPPAKYSFFVQSPFWGTWWFRILALAALASALHLAIRHRTRTYEAAKVRLKEEVDARTAELKHEIDLRKDAMSALRESEEKFRYLIENVNDVIFATTPDGVITYMSPAIEPLAGARAEFLLGENLSLLLDEGEAARHGQEWDELGDGNVRTGEYRIGAGLAETRWIRVSEKATIVDGEVVAVQGVLTDITRQKGLENKLLQASKLESIGQLAAGIAHEINTPIQFVSGNTSFLQECFEDFDELPARIEAVEQARATGSEALAEALDALREYLDGIEIRQLLEDIPTAIRESLDGLGRISEIVAAMKQFSHPGTKEKSLADLRTVVQSTVAVSRNSWKDTAEVTCDFPEDLPMVPCIPSELSQVFLNMIVNSAQAMEGRTDGLGQIYVGARDLEDWVEIVVQDNGSGIPEDVLDRVFDPFFTTKEVGQGTGQGLAISRDVIVARHGGTLDVASEIGSGTRFTVRLPKEEARKAA